MVSEGVDVPRLAVGVYATSASTPLFFAQAIGRFVRSRRPGETASIFLPSVPNLLQLASELEAQRNHVLGKPHRESDDDPLDAELAEQRRDRTQRTGQRFRVAGRRRRTGPGHLRRLVVRHRDPGRQRRGGRLPRHPRACSTPARCATCWAAGRTSSCRSAPRRATCRAPPSTHGQLRELRRELNALVSVAHHRTGKPHGWIHNELRRICGGPPIAAATTDATAGPHQGGARPAPRALRDFGASTPGSDVRHAEIPVPQLFRPVRDQRPADQRRTPRRDLSVLLVDRRRLRRLRRQIGPVHLRIGRVAHRQPLRR